MSGARTSRPVRFALGAAAAAFAAGLAGPAPAPARAAGDAADRPVFFKEPDLESKKKILDAISLFGDPSPSNRERSRDVLADIGYWSVDFLLDVVKEMKANFKSNALLVLGRLADPQVLPRARATLQDDTLEWPPVIAALVLGRMKDADPEAMAAYRKVVAASEKQKRQVATALTLGKLHRRRPEECAALLEQLLDAKTAHPPVHYAAMLSLGFYRGRVVEELPDHSGFQPSSRVRAALADPREGMRLSAILAMSVAYNNAFHAVFLDRFRNDGDREVRRAALLAIGRNPDAATTALLVETLDGQKSNVEERRMAAYLLNLRSDSLKGDAKALDVLHRAATAPRAQEIAAAALIALAGVDDPRVPTLVVAKLGDRSATVRAAAAVAATRLRKAEDLGTVRDALKRRLEAGENDEAAKADMALAIEEIGQILKDREDAAKGIEPKKRAAPAWQEADTEDLFETLGRDHRRRVFDFVNLRVLQVLGIDGLYEYRPVMEAGTQPTDITPNGAGAGNRTRREHSVFSEPYDVRIELDRRPFFVPEDDPDVAPAAVPREPK